MMEAAVRIHWLMKQRTHFVCSAAVAESNIDRTKIRRCRLIPGCSAMGTNGRSVSHFSFSAYEWGD